MTKPFSRSAEVYDLIHASKNYDGEATTIAQWLEPTWKISPFRPRLIDVGCGTGEFTRRFIEMGFDAVGLDTSVPMATIANEKGVRAYSCDVFTMPFRQEVEAVTCLYGAFCYMTVDGWSILQRTLQAVRGMLRHRGLFVFDVINAHAPVREYREDVFGEVTRKMNKRRDHVNQSVIHDIEYTYQGETWQEQHIMRAYTPNELKYALQHCGFRVKSITNGFDSPDDYCNWGTSAVDGSMYYFSVLAEAE